MPKVCDACKNKNEDDNEIVENLCKNDFGKYEGDTRRLFRTALCNKHVVCSGLSKVVLFSIQHCQLWPHLLSM